MNRKIAVAALTFFFFINHASVSAQQAQKLRRIGILRAGAPPDRTLELFLQALRDLGYVEGKNITIDIRFAEGNQKRPAELAKELVQLKVDALFTSGTRSILDLKDASKSIPIVMVSTSDPIGTGKSGTPADELNRPRATKCGSRLASSSEATIVAQQSAFASTGCHSSARLLAIMAATASRVTTGFSRSLVSGPVNPIAVQNASQNFCSSAAHATSAPSAVR